MLIVLTADQLRLLELMLEGLTLAVVLAYTIVSYLQWRELKGQSRLAQAELSEHRREVAFEQRPRLHIHVDLTAFARNPFDPGRPFDKTKFNIEPKDKDQLVARILLQLRLSNRATPLRCLKPYYHFDRSWVVRFDRWNGNFGLQDFFATVDEYVNVMNALLAEQIQAELYIHAWFRPVGPHAGEPEEFPPLKYSLKKDLQQVSAVNLDGTTRTALAEALLWIWEPEPPPDDVRPEPPVL
jgi:hypothetical protein